jgi:hypothetical protein
MGKGLGINENTKKKMDIEIKGEQSTTTEYALKTPNTLASTPN